MARDPMVRWLLRAEGVAVFVLGTALYAGAGGELLLLIPLFVPDMDRALGYGLKYPTSFQDTHLGRIGKRRDEAARPAA